MRFYTVESLSERQHLTPEGYLVVENVPIARTGEMLYAAGEVPVQARDGIVRIQRSAEDVFQRSVLESFEGKPVCLDHPPVDVNPSNWSQLTKGFLQNVRRGTGDDKDFLVTDLLITDASAIRQVREGGLREVSCGYDADYEELAPGRGRQFNILGNHLALVDKGRCGSRCAIGDTMKKLKWMDRLRSAFKARDEADFEKSLTLDVEEDEEESEEEKKKRLAKEEAEKKTEDTLAKVLDKVTSLDARLARLEKTRDQEDEEESEDEKKKRLAQEKKEKEEEDGKTEDSAGLAAEVQDVAARAEILAPGLHLPTFDRKASAQATRDALCGLKRKALQRAYDSAHKDAVTPFVGKTADFKTLTCDAVAAAFLGASEIVRQVNNAQSAAAVQATFDGSKAAAGVAQSISDINRRNAEFWKRN